MGTKVFLAEGQSRTRSALRLLLEQEQEVDVVGEAAWAGDVLAGVDAAEPDILLLDWGLPGLRGADLLRALRTLRSDVKVIVLSGRPEVGRDALAAGADAFVSKGEPPERLLVTLQSIARRKAAAWRGVVQSE